MPKGKLMPTMSPELRERLIAKLDQDWAINPFISTHDHILDVIDKEIEAAGLILLPVKRLAWLHDAVGACQDHYDCIGYYMKPYSEEE
jgi:hypothetical protein